MPSIDIVSIANRCLRGALKSIKLIRENLLDTFRGALSKIETPLFSPNGLFPVKISVLLLRWDIHISAYIFINLYKIHRNAS